MSKDEKRIRNVMVAAFVGFLATGVFYVAAPPRTTSQYFDTSVPAIMWGIVFAIGGLIAVLGVMRRTPHLERLGLMFIVIAGTVLTLSQAAVMLSAPVTWTRGGGTGAYASFTLLAFAFWMKLRKKVEVSNLAADLPEGRETPDGS